MNKNILFSLLLLSVCVPTQTLLAKGSIPLVKSIVGKGIGKNIPASFYNVGAAGVAQHQISELYRSVLFASRTAITTPFSPKEIRLLTASDAASPRLLSSIFAAPKPEMLSLLHQEFLTLTGVHKIPVSADQLQLSLHFFRRGLVVNTDAFIHMEKYN